MNSRRIVNGLQLVRLIYMHIQHPGNHREKEDDYKR